MDGTISAKMVAMEEWAKRYQDKKASAHSWRLLKYIAFLETITMFSIWIVDGKPIYWNLIWIFLTGSVCIISNKLQVDEQKELREYLSATDSEII